MKYGLCGLFALPLVVSAWQGADESEPAPDFAAFAALARAGAEPEALRNLAAELLEREGEAALDERQRALVQFAVGVSLASDPPAGADGEVPPDAVRAALVPFDAARAGAGPGALRLDATYDKGWVELDAAERWYARIPEVLAASGAPPQPAEEGAPEPLMEARARYEAARTHLVERLQLDWRDADTRANLEWIQRRLRELERLEEEQKQQEEQQQQQDQQQDSKPEGEPSSEPSDPSESEPGEQEPGEQEPGEQEPGEQEPGEEGQPEEQPGEDDAQAPQEGDETPDARAPEEEPAEAAAGEEGQEQPAERILTREEAMRLLDRLKAIEEQGERLRAELRAARRVPVERDW